jgi:beta-carotene 15,15'-dioxygenase
MTEVTTAKAVREWFSALRHAHAIAALAVIALICVVYPFLGQHAVVVQHAVVISIALLLSLPHASLDQYSAFIAMQPPLGRFWPLGFIIFYGLSATSVAFGWVFAPQVVLPLLVALSVLHFGLGDVDERSWMRWLEVFTRGAAPYTLAVLFNPGPIAALLGWLILDVRLATVAIYDYAVPIAMIWQVGWVVVVVRHMWIALAQSSWGAAIVAAEMSLLVLAFAVLPPLVAFVLYAGLLHAPRHIIDFADRNPWSASPPGAVLRVIRAAVIPTGMTVTGLAFAFYFVSSSDLPSSHVLRMGVWIVTAFSVPHMLLVLLSTRPLTGFRRVLRSAPDKTEVGSTRGS